MHIIRGEIKAAVSLDDIKAVGRVEHDEDDTMLALLAASVTSEYCQRLNVALLPETMVVTFDTWLCTVPLRLPIGPLSEANAASLTASQTIGTIQAIAPTDLSVRHGERPTLTVNASPQGPLTVTYTAGLPAAPQYVRAAMAAQVAFRMDAQDVETQSRRYAPAYAAALNTRKRVSI